MANYLDVPTASGASTPHQAGLAAGTGSFDLRIELAANDWTSGAYQALLSQDNGSGGAGGARFWWGITPTGTLEYDFYNSAGGTVVAGSVAPTVADGSSIGLRVLHNIGAGTVDWYTSSNFSSWSTLDTQDSGLATTGMATAGTAPVVRIGTDTYSEPMVGKITRVMVLVGASTILNWDITTATLGTGPWTATSGETWTRIGTASVASAGGGGGGTAATSMLLTGVGV